ncbi:endonuclease/exonuclease/phosphatase family protein [Pseudomonas eucalypticola]|nr:endonuclease/exonuclease/phosphatase family protein [Pseudomonas eucalypticola]
MFRTLTTALLALMLVCGQAFADVRIGTWNLEHLSVRPGKDFASIAKVAQNVDFLAVQELMNEDGLTALQKALEQATGSKWSAMASHATGRSSYKEMYGFVWRDDAVAYEDGAVTYLDKGDHFEREPYSARFRNLKDNTAFVAATVHIHYGKTVADRTKEIAVLGDYWDWLKSVYDGNTNIMLMGDFNTPPTSTAWAGLRTSARPLMLQGASTLSTTDGQFSNLYDNIFVANESTIKVKTVQVFDYPSYLKMSNAKGRSSVSDHAPIFLDAVMGGKASGKATPFASTAPASKPQVASADSSTAATGPVRGNRNSQTYHRPDCPSYNTIAAKNRVEFDSEAAALAAHYHIAGNCR